MALPGEPISQPSGGETGDVAAETQAFLDAAPQVGALALEAREEAGNPQRSEPETSAAREPGPLRRAGGKILEAATGVLDYAIDHGLGLGSHPSSSDHFTKGPRVHQWQVTRDP